MAEKREAAVEQERLGRLRFRLQRLEAQSADLAKVVKVAKSMSAFHCYGPWLGYQSHSLLGGRNL
jgi:hypothetical protein